LQQFLIQDEPWRYGVVYDWNMQLIMDDKQIQTLEQVQQFVDSSQGIEFSGLNPKRKISMDRGGAKEIQVSLA